MREKHNKMGNRWVPIVLSAFMIGLLAVSLYHGAAARIGEGEGAKNVILMIGDGMGPAQVTAARWDRAGEDLAKYATTRLNMDDLDWDGHVTTYCADAFITDSAPAITALLTGQKTNSGVIGEDSSSVNRKTDGKSLESIAEAAHAKGKATGAVTTTRITHATPAGLYAHVNDRDDESRIADQLLGGSVDLALGGGYGFFIDKGMTDPFGSKGKRSDGKDITKDFTKAGYTLVTDEKGLSALPNNTKKVLGLFNSSHMLYEMERDGSKEPGLAEMTQKSIDILSQDPDGFFLMVEGGRIDHASHERSYGNTVGDTLAFDEAVKVARDFVAENKDTLLIVTADHETGGLDLGATNVSDYKQGMTPFFGSGMNTTDMKCFSPQGEGSHTGEDVLVMATGPSAPLVSQGMIDNTDIYRIMKGALGL